ncbi:nucleoside triphosphate pyrophosphohydrolase ham1, variant 2 [Coccidioides posadasii str. Silveira]|uniref:nucleoside triphosphate pyrophosphohydrolase ham1, variant 2 n=1 Tax=Coccidioides posadasii (strain RMSCC 757 / Silveira) TaxID=443226 RepID=UPI001BF088A4|nr:nucleoside triphosphate pyrophosphohydrolase ham1, variant 2 [Coccidioides posadasii str. Silveira]
MKSINFITGNKNKLTEVQAILGDAIEVQNKPVDLPELQGTIEDIAREKCKNAANAVRSPSLLFGFIHISKTFCPWGVGIILTRSNIQVNGPVLTEDTALEFNALGGLPGPYIKWFLEKLGHEGLNKLLYAFEDKSAVAVCTFAFAAGPGEEPILFQGRTDGKIVPARGPAKFGLFNQCILTFLQT